MRASGRRCWKRTVPAYFALDLRPLALRFRDSYASPLRYLLPSYYRDGKALRAKARTSAPSIRDGWRWIWIVL